MTALAEQATFHGEQLQESGPVIAGLTRQHTGEHQGAPVYNLRYLQKGVELQIDEVQPETQEDTAQTYVKETPDERMSVQFDQTGNITIIANSLNGSFYSKISSGQFGRTTSLHFQGLFYLIVTEQPDIEVSKQIQPEQARISITNLPAITSVGTVFPAS